MVAAIDRGIYLRDLVMVVDSVTEVTRVAGLERTVARRP